jgi:hypothetical protein
MISTDNKQIEEFFQLLKNIDRDMLVIEDFKDQMKRVQWNDNIEDNTNQEGSVKGSTLRKLLKLKGNN